MKHIFVSHISMYLIVLLAKFHWFFLGSQLSHPLHLFNLCQQQPLNYSRYITSVAVSISVIYCFMIPRENKVTIVMCFTIRTSISSVFSCACVRACLCLLAFACVCVRLYGVGEWAVEHSCIFCNVIPRQVGSSPSSTVRPPLRSEAGRRAVGPSRASSQGFTTMA